MPSKAVTGMPGASKSYYVTVHVIWEELLNSKRKIVTNIPLRMGELQKSLDARGRSDVRVAERIEILEYEQVGEFWRHRGPGVELLPKISPEQSAKGVRPDFSEIDDGGVLYALDELHEHLNSRAWKDTGPVVLFYIAKHRHLGDDVYWITQAPKNVDSQWRSVTQEYIYCRNYGMEKFGIFAKGSNMEAVAYLEMFTGSQTPQWTKRYRLDKEGRNWYHTSVYKGGADMGRKVKGVPVWVLFAGIIAVAVLFWFGSDWIVRAYVGNKSRKSQENYDAKVATPVVEPPAVAGVPSAVIPVTQRNTVAGFIQEQEKPPVHLLAVPLQYSTADRVLTAMEKTPQSSSITLVPNASNGAVLIQGSDFQAVAVAAERVRQFDVTTAQIAVHCVVARRTLSEGSDVGLFAMIQDIARGTATGSRLDIADALTAVALDLSSGLATFGGSWSARMALDAFTQFVSTDSKYEVMSHPVLVVTSGQPAQFSAGREIPIPRSNSTQDGVQNSIDYKQAEFKFEVRPTLMGSGTVQVDIKQSNADVIGTALIAGNQIPTLATQSLSSTVTMTEKQLLYVGGVVVETAVDNDTGTPYARKVPVLNWFVGRRVKQTEKSELFVLFTVEIYRAGDGPVRVEKAIAVKKRSDTKAAKPLRAAQH